MRRAQTDPAISGWRADELRQVFEEALREAALTPMSDQDLVEIETRATAATMGPWHTALRLGTYRKMELRAIFGPNGTTLVPGTRPYATLQTADAEFVAHARTDVPRLLAEVRRLRAELAEGKHDR